MPWDATTLWAADLAITGTAMLDIAEPRNVVAGGRTAPEAGGAPASVSDAAWGPDGALWFASDHLNGYWNAMACPPGLPEAGSGRPVGLGRWEVAQPRWVFGRCRLAPLPGGGALSARRVDGRDLLTLLPSPTRPRDGEGVGGRRLLGPHPGRRRHPGGDLAVGSGPAGVLIVAAVVAGADSLPHVRWWHEHDLITTAAEEAGDRPEEGAGAQRHPDGRFLSGPGTSQGLVSLAPEWSPSRSIWRFSTESATEAGAEVFLDTGWGGGRAHPFALYYPPRNPEVGDGAWSRRRWWCASTAALPLPPSGATGPTCKFLDHAALPSPTSTIAARPDTAVPIGRLCGERGGRRCGRLRDGG